MPNHPPAEIVKQIETGDLQTLTHSDHVQLAWTLLRDGPFDSAIQKIRALLRDFAASKGQPGKFHETITWAFVLIIQERMLKSTTTSWPQFREENPDLFDAKEMLRLHYSEEKLQSSIARENFLLPDRHGG